MTQFHRLTPFKRCVLQNFPFIEEDFDALTNYALLCKVVEYLNKVIKSQNDLGAEVENFEETINTDFQELLSRFNNLKDYVDNYFDNLDVQEEINNKLDEMTEAGTIADIIAGYIQLKGILAYDNVASMKSAVNLVNGSFAETYGFFAKGDGGSAKYKVREITNQDVVDEMTIIALADEDLVAELIIGDDAHTKQFGIFGDGTTDVTTKLNTFFEKTINCNKRVVDEGTYLTSDKIVIKGLWRRRTGNNGAYSINFENASILYTGTAGVAVLIHSMFKGEITGLCISEESTAGSKVALIGCWFNNFSNWNVRSLELTNDPTIATGISYTTQSLEYLNFSNVNVYGTLYMKTLNDPDGSFINSINFYNCAISGEGNDYCVVFGGNRSKQAINFYNCDISYPEVAVFDIPTLQNGRGTVSLFGCYLDSNKPIFHNDTKNDLEFNILMSAVPASSNNEIFNIKYTDFIKNTFLGGYYTHGYNIAMSNINYSINGDLSSQTESGGGGTLMGDSYGDWSKEYVDSNLSKSGKARKITLQRTATNPHLTVSGITAPRTDTYTAYMRLKVLSGTYESIQLVLRGVYASTTSERIGENEVLVISRPVNIEAGTSLDYTFYFIGQNMETLVAEIYEVGITEGKTYIPNAPLHENAKIVEA